MERKKPLSGEFFRHFKGKIYQIKMLAKDSESKEEVVVYQAMYPPYSVWVRGLKEFMEPVDREKYPQAKQEYRFVKVTFQAEQEKSEENEKDENKILETREEQTEKNGFSLSHEEFIKAITSGASERYLSGKMTDDEIAERGFVELLDAESFGEKRQIFIGLKPYLTPLLLSNIAVALDIVLEEEEPEMQYDSILRCLNTFEHYEGGRLR